MPQERILSTKSYLEQHNGLNCLLSTISFTSIATIYRSLHRQGMQTCKQNGSSFRSTDVIIMDADLYLRLRAGTVESRIRQLVMKLEYVDSLTLAHPFIKGFDQTSYCLDDAEVRACASGDIPEVVARRKKEDIEGKEGASVVHTTTFYIGLAIEPKQRTYRKPLSFLPHL